MPVLRRYSYIINIPYCFSVSIVVFDKNSVGILCNITKNSFLRFHGTIFFMLSDIYDRKKRLKVPRFTECLQKTFPEGVFSPSGKVIFEFPVLYLSAAGRVSGSFFSASFGIAPSFC